MGAIQISLEGNNNPYQSRTFSYSLPCIFFSYCDRNLVLKIFRFEAIITNIYPPKSDIHNIPNITPTVRANILVGIFYHRTPLTIFKEIVSACHRIRWDVTHFHQNTLVLKKIKGSYPETHLPYDQWCILKEGGQWSPPDTSPSYPHCSSI